MARKSANWLQNGRLVPAMTLVALSWRAGLAGTTLPANLALHEPTTSSSIENDEHDASHANDGLAATSWTADDEPEGGADWWQVDLGSAFDLSDCEITWPFDRMNYRCKVEGSADRKQWQMLSDQTATKSRAQVQRLAFTNARAIRYLRITITGFDDGCCAGISEVKVYGSIHSSN